MPEPVRYVNFTNHECGCQSRFDTEKWRSDLFRPCAEHERLIKLYEPERPVSPTPDTMSAETEIQHLRNALVFADGLAVSQTGSALADLYAADCEWAQTVLRNAGCHPRGAWAASREQTQ